jgi:hypothetical protein
VETPSFYPGLRSGSLASKESDDCISSRASGLPVDQAGQARPIKGRFVL